VYPKTPDPIGKSDVFFPTPNEETSNKINKKQESSCATNTNNKDCINYDYPKTRPLKVFTRFI
jgi:hypothetical protein